MTLHCWMHWFWITFVTVITVLPDSGVCLPVSANASSGLSPPIHEVPSIENAVRHVRPLEESATAGPELAEVVSAAALPPSTDPVITTNNKPSKTVYATLHSNKSNAENRALTYDKESANRNRVDVAESVRLDEGVFPVPGVDDSGDTEGALQIGPVAANVDLKTDAGKQLVSRPNDTTVMQTRDQGLRYNAVIPDASLSNPKATVLSECSECSTTITSAQEQPEQIQNITENTASTVTEVNNVEILSAENNTSENITRIDDIGLIQEESTEEVLSRSSLTVQERREPLGKSLGHAVVSDAESESGMDPGAIAGISLGVLAIATLASAASFVLYRTRYLNNPQTLSDKCSNPDSSGYIDDSTMRENSEEMYSLDNDSFLNSLEAMTIQNYWTDSVKHTKL